MDASTASLVGNNGHGEDIRPYKIHVSSKYLDLTRKKLELTRLPHELLLPPTREWENGTPKSEIEPLIDFWLETYSWRTQETHLNNTLPQFRTAIKVGETGPLRIHFLHLRSTHPTAIPLLLIPSFPLTNLSLQPSLWKSLLEPTDDAQAFHIIVPSIPGLGFSDAFTTTSRTLESTAEIFNILMKRLGYEHYLASSTGSGIDSPAHIDYHLPLLLTQHHAEICLGVHLIAPPLSAPTLKQPFAWLKFGIARFFHASIFGYQASDFAALRASKALKKKGKSPWKSEDTTPLLARAKGTGYGAVGMIGLREPNTLAYALCDSPVGLLSLVTSALRKRSPEHKLAAGDVVDVCQLAWLPGPEAGMRFWSAAVSEVEELKAKRTKRKARVAVTVFEEEEEGYVCPAWAAGAHGVVWSQRVVGRAGLLSFERESVLIEGVQGLAEAVAKADPRLRVGELEGIVVDSEETIAEELTEEEHDLQLEVESPDTVVASTPYS